MIKQYICRLFGHFPVTTVNSSPVEILWKYEVVTRTHCACCKQILGQTSRLSLTDIS